MTGEPVDLQPVPAEALSRDLVNALAARHNLPVGEVGLIFARQFRALARDAPAGAYLQVLAAQLTSRILAHE